MIELRPNPEISSMIQEKCVRRMAVLRMRVGKSFRDGFPSRRSGCRPPDEDEKAEIEEFARTNGLSGRFDVAADRVFINKMSSGGINDFVEETEFHLFRRRDVPYLMSLKAAYEVMES